MALGCSCRPLSVREWIDFLNQDFNNPVFPVKREDEMEVCYDMEFDFEEHDVYGVSCYITGYYTDGDRLYFTFKRDAPASNFTYNRVLEIFKNNIDKEVYLIDLDKKTETPAYYGEDIGCSYLSTIAGNTPQ